MDWPNVHRVPGKQRTNFLHAIQPLLPAHPTCAELGVLRGDWAVSICQILQPHHLVLIDPWKIDPTKCYQLAAFGGYKQGETPTAYSTDRHLRWTRGKMDKMLAEGNVHTVTILPKYSYEAAPDYPDHYFDLVYIDASHLYHDVQRDLADWYPKIKPGGLLCGHDYKPFADHGVIEAVDEFCQSRHLQITILAKEGDYAIPC